MDGEGPIGALKGVGTTVVPYYIKHVHGSATVSITIQGTFNIGYYPGGPYYINWMSFDAVTSSSSSTLFYAKNGGASVTGYIDGGRTMVVTQNFDIYTYGTLTASTSVSYTHLDVYKRQRLTDVERALQQAQDICQRVVLVLKRTLHAEQVIRGILPLAHWEILCAHRLQMCIRDSS